MGSVAFHKFLRFEQSSSSDCQPPQPQPALHQVEHDDTLAKHDGLQAEHDGTQAEQDGTQAEQDGTQAEHDDTRAKEGRSAPPESPSDAGDRLPLTIPPTAVSKASPSLEWMPASAPSPTPHTRSMPASQQEFNLSRTSSPSAGQPVDAFQTFSNPPINKWRVLSACLTLLGNGMNDSAPGALLPAMENFYKIGYAIVSMIFIGNALGFILAALFVHALDKKVGRSKTLMLCDIALVVGYSIMVSTPPFPLYVVAFVITGWGMASGLALNNVFGANLANATVILGAFHGSYGIGGIIAPIIATTMVKSGVIFSRFYIVLLGIRVISLVLGGWAFRSFERGNSPVDLITPLNRNEQAQRGGEEHVSQKPMHLKEALKNRTTLIGGLFLCAYQGAEVAISGWVISFLINYRNSKPSRVGYVTAGFWGGITLGRFFLTYAAHRIGEKAFTYGLIAGALGFQLFVWFLPNVIADSIGIALLGLLLGPVYPLTASRLTRLLPRRLQNTAMALVSSAGSTGGAIAPFLTGILAQAVGIWILHPICISLFVVMEICWFCLPNIQKRRE